MSNNETLTDELDIQDIDVINKNLVETTIRMLGDVTTISQVIELLAYIRHGVKNNLNTEIKVKIGKNIVNTPFAFDVNGQEIKDYILQSEIEIN